MAVAAGRHYTASLQSRRAALVFPASAEFTPKYGCLSGGPLRLRVSGALNNGLVLLCNERRYQAVSYYLARDDRRGEPSLWSELPWHFPAGCFERRVTTSCRVYLPAESRRERMFRGHLGDVTPAPPPPADMVLTFIQSHPLVDQAVSHHRHQPVFHRRDLVLTHLVVDRVTSGTFGSDREYTVYYAGSSERRDGAERAGAGPSGRDPVGCRGNTDAL